MDNVNNLNGVPNFGHGFPEDVPEDEVIPEAAESVELKPEEESEVEINNQEE